MQAIKKARKEGLKIPISDMPVTDFDLVKAQEERDKLREEEAKRNSKSVYYGLLSVGSKMGATRDNEVKYNLSEAKC